MKLSNYRKIKYHVDYSSGWNYSSIMEPLEVFYDDNDNILDIKIWTDLLPKKSLWRRTGPEISREAFDELILYESYQNEYRLCLDYWVDESNEKFKHLKERYFNFDFPELAKSVYGKFEYWWHELGGPVWIVFYSPEKKWFVARNEEWRYDNQIFDRLFASSNWDDWKITKDQYYEYLNIEREKAWLPIFTERDQTPESELERTKILYFRDQKWYDDRMHRLTYWDSEDNIMEWWKITYRV